VLSAIEAANGTIMFGWTTALIFLVRAAHHSPRPARAESRESDGRTDSDLTEQRLGSQYASLRR
jgi:hypothetical protein